MHGFVCRCEKCEVRSASPLGIAAVSSASSQGAACEQVQRGVARVRKMHPAGSDERLEALRAFGLRALEEGLYEDAVAIHRRLLREAALCSQS